jgi:hypothetical protein
MHQCTSIPFSDFGSFEKIHEYIKQKGKVFVLLGEGRHKIKKKSEQLACEQALSFLK